MSRAIHLTVTEARRLKLPVPRTPKRPPLPPLPGPDHEHAWQREGAGAWCTQCGIFGAVRVLARIGYVL